MANHFVFVFSVGILLQSSVVLTQQYGSTTPVPGGCICTTIFQPVCGVDGKDYSNACVANCAGVAVASNGSCSPATTTAPAGCVCPAIFQPVCGVDGKDYSNACVANCAGVAVASNGSCSPATTTPQSPATTTTPSSSTPSVSSTTAGSGTTSGSCICTLEFNPVCGADGKTYGNACQAKCAGVYVAHTGSCS